MNNKIVVGAVALVSAGLASVCCIGPVIVTGLGLGSLGLAAGLTQYRPLFLALTGLVLAAGFYLAYRKRPATCADGSCELRSGSRTVKAALWAITAMTLGVATFPNVTGTIFLDFNPWTARPAPQRSRNRWRRSPGSTPLAWILTTSRLR